MSDQMDDLEKLEMLSNAVEVVSKIKRRENVQSVDKKVELERCPFCSKDDGISEQNSVWQADDGTPYIRCEWGGAGYFLLRKKGKRKTEGLLPVKVELLIEKYNTRPLEHAKDAEIAALKYQYDESPSRDELMDECVAMSEEQLQFRRELEPIIKQFKYRTKTMRDTMTEIEEVYQSQLAGRDKEIEELVTKIIRFTGYARHADICYVGMVKAEPCRCGLAALKGE